MSPLSPKDRRTLLREEFACFVERCFRELNPGTEYVHAEYIHLVAGWMSACEREGMRLIVNLPPRHLKSLIGSVALVAWMLGRDPKLRVICASYAGDLAKSFSRQCRQVMESAWYQAVFPQTRLRRSTETLLETTRGGFRMATSIDGALTGYGADLIIVDDPMQAVHAGSDPIRKGVNDWFDEALFSRLNDKQTGRILVIMQRLHEDDLTGHLLARGGWNKLVLPAIAGSQEAFEYEIVGTTRVYRRNVGAALHPGREPLDVLMQIKRSIGEYNFAGQYQQAPAPQDGGMVKRGWFKEYGEAERPETFDMVLQSWDTANKPGELNDYSVCTTWGTIKNRTYLLHVLRKKLSFPELKRAVREQAGCHRPDIVLIEDKASGTQLIQELSFEGLRGVQAYKPEAGLNKVMRMRAQTPDIENGLVFLPKAAEWLDPYLHELTIFPYGKHDDQVDSTAQALHYLKMEQRAEPALLTYYREQHEQEEERRNAESCR